MATRQMVRSMDRSNMEATSLLAGTTSQRTEAFCPASQIMATFPHGQDRVDDPLTQRQRCIRLDSGDRISKE
jgi:hypothetical protein